MPRTRIVRFCFYSFTIAQLISIFGDRLHQFSVVGMIGKVAPGSSVELFQFALFTQLPVFLFAPVLGSYIDRTHKVRLLVLVDVFRGALVLCIPTLFHLSGSLYAFYAPAFFLSSANLLFSPAKSAVIPELFGKPKLLQINAVLWALGIVGTLGGFLLGGWLFDYRSWQWSFYSDGGSYIISVLFLLPLFALHPPGKPPADATNPLGTARRPHPGLVRSIREGLRPIRRNPRVSHGILIQTALFAALGVFYVIGLARIQELLPVGRTIYLSVVACVGTLGLLCGSLLAALLRRHLSAHRIIAHSTIILAVAWIGLSRVTTLAGLLGLGFVMGTAISPIMVITETLLQLHIPETLRGRVFSTREVTTRLAFLATSTVATGLGAFVGKPSLLLVIGLLLAGTGVLMERRNFLRV